MPDACHVDNADKYASGQSRLYKHAMSTSRLTRRMLTMMNMMTNMQVIKASLINVMFHIATNTPESRDVDKYASERSPSFKLPFSTSRLTRHELAMLKTGTNMQVSEAPVLNVHFPHRN